MTHIVFKKDGDPYIYKGRVESTLQASPKTASPTRSLIVYTKIQLIFYTT